jgi:hypothetical protein
MNWVNIPLVNELFSKYTEIVEKSWEEIIENKSVNQVNLYSFNVFQDDANRKLKTYFEQNRDKYEELDNYRNTKGRPSLQLTIFEYDMLKSLDDYQDLPEWIDYKELSKMYLERMGSEIYRYYDKKDLPLISYYKQGGSVLLAPNGKPSNLTPEQYKLVRKPEFKAWFGDWENDKKNSSEVLDENGEPLVLYHFSDKKFNVFELKSASEGFFFTENRYDDEFSYEGIVKALDSGNYPQWLKEYIEVTGYSHNKIKKILKGQMTYKKAKAYFLNIKKMFPANRVAKFTRQQWSIPMIENSYIREAKIEGYNGVVFVRKTDKKRIIVALHPEQIKLADGTNTTFDAGNPDIRYAEGGLMKRRSGK